MAAPFCQEKDAVAQAIRVLRAGGVIALPTETVYGLAADARNELAVRKIFAVKGRPATHPLIVHLADASDLPRWASTVSPQARKLAEAFWPGPLTLIVPRTDLASDAVTGGQGTVAVRVPSHPVAREVIRGFGSGLAAPSANRFGKVSPTTAQHVREDLDTEVDFILDGGPCEIGVESTIVDLSGPVPALLRPGGTPTEQIERALGKPLASSASTGPRAPGMLPSHYAPRAGVIIAGEGDALKKWRSLSSERRRVAVLGPSSEVPTDLREMAGVYFPAPEQDTGFARVLYATLRQIDAAGFDAVVVVPPREGKLADAIWDRLAKASAPRG